MKCKSLLPLLACGACLALSPALRAQDATPAPATTGTEAAPAGPGGIHGHAHGEAMLERWKTQLDLTPEQVAQIKPIVATFRTQVQTIRADTTLAHPDMVAKMRDARETEVAQIKAVLNPDQQTKFDQMMAAMRNHHHGGPNGQGGAPGAAATPSASPAATP